MSKRRTIAYAALALAAIAVLVIVLIAAFTPHRCFLDVLNAQIERQTEFEPFYAGREGLPAPREFIPQLGDIEDAFPAVQAEALAVFDAHVAAKGGAGEVPRMDATYNQIFQAPGAPRGPLGRASRWAGDKVSRLIYGPDVDIFTKIGSDDWRTFNLVLYNRDVPGNVEKCPELTRLVRAVPGMQSALISIIAPGTYIPPHSDPAKGVIRYHLAFKTPKKREQCYIAIEDAEGVAHKYAWEEGKGVVFDDVFTHWVRNDTDEYRVILFMDILRPMAGAPRALQSLANFANGFHPGVRRLIRASRV